MADKEIKIKLTIDNAEATASMNAFGQTASKSVKSLAEEKRAASKKELTDDQVLAAAKTQIIQKSNRERIDASAKSLEAEKKTLAAAKEVNASILDTGSVSKASGLSMVAAFAFGATAMSKLIGLAREYNAALEEGAKKSRELTKGFANQADQLRELAELTGNKSGAAFTLKNAEFNAKAGLKFEEGLAFRTEFQNQGAQAKDVKISGKEHTEFELDAARLAAAKGVSPQEIGSLAGTMLNLKDRTKMGEGASDDAIGDLYSGVGILGRGAGRAPVLLRQFQMAAASMFNEDAEQGIFQNPDELASVISTFAEKHDAQANEMAQGMNRGLRGFNDKDAGPLLKRAGIDPKTGAIEGLRKLAPIILAEAKARGEKTIDTTNRYFTDNLTAEAINVGINRGVTGGLFDERAAFAKTLRGPGKAMKFIEESEAGDTGRLRTADAAMELAKAKRGATGSKAEILRRQAAAEAMESGEIDSESASLKEFLSGTLTFGMMKIDEQKVIDTKAASILNRRRPGAVPDGRGTRAAMPGLIAFKSGESNTDVLTERIERLAREGADPFSDTKQMAQYLKELVAGQEADRRARAREIEGRGLPPVLGAGPPVSPTRP